MEDLIANFNLRILPAGGAKEVKRIFNYLELPLDEDRKDIRGKIFCLIDTDAQLLSFEAKDRDGLIARRLLNAGGQCRLLKVADQTVSPPTEIEDSLEANTFVQVISELEEKLLGSDDLTLNLMQGYIDKKKPSYFAFDWRQSDRETLKRLLDTNDGDAKLDFANSYVRNAKANGAPTPLWVNEIRKFFSE
ncbi:hypothetical protein [Thiohalomonas denitrificans]|uniref:hypothetical protein n=1 Tax=Thiohalomonas denitrificans TaxID=415747 RepID=UPI000B86415B|nr:hypothetical protein [Thiohalomonas denitrificans]